MRGCEIRDYVVNPDSTVVVRQQSEAANAELVRRGHPELVVPSGELAPYAIAWVNSCTGNAMVEDGT